MSGAPAPADLPSLPSCLEDPQGRVSWWSGPRPNSAQTAAKDSVVTREPGVRAVSTPDCVFRPASLLSLSGLPREDRPPWPPRSGGTPGMLALHPRRDKASRTLGVGSSASLLPSPDPRALALLCLQGPWDRGAWWGLGLEQGSQISICSLDHSPLLASWSRGRSPTGTPTGVVTPHRGRETSMEAQESRGAGRKGSWGVLRGEQSEMGGGAETGVCLPFPGSRRGNRAHGGARSPRPARPPWRAGTDRNSWERRHKGQQRAREGAPGRTGFGCLRGQPVGDLTGQRSLCPTWEPGSGSSASFPFRVTPDPLGPQGRMVPLV